MIEKKTCIVVIFFALLIVVPSVRADWPEIRGPFGDGHVSAPGNTKPIGLPLRWGENENVKWKTEIPHRGWSTPVVLGNQIWLTTATTNGNDFFAICVDADTGKIVFNQKLFHCDNPEPLANNVNCYAAPSPAIEQGRVYVHFGSYGTACLDTSNAGIIWQRNDLPCRHYRGPGSSIILFEDLLMLTMDGVDVQYIVALDKKTGKTVWKTDRTAIWNDLGPDGKPFREGDCRKAYSIPLIVNVGGKYQMFTPSAKAMYAYEPKTGVELWKVRHICYSSVARPLFSKGLVMMATGMPKLEMLAIKVDGQGDVTDSHVVWRIGKAVGRIPSPILVDDLLYLISDDGTVTCLEVATGQQVWQERIRSNYYSSPIYGDGRIYFFSNLGKTTVLKAGRTYGVLATNTLENGFMASPAVLGKSLILRTKTHLYRIEESATSSGK
ncbi:MAG: PQQ-binding-like beta-propeller repeat protein [Kiritimatiellae bacterium]|nr:PQQ-binding-like beta-propeller repeat protein [Kiritimatiellia bacterium]MDD5519869.1 PQQ-binding-like beta-propeller repeat protein [Kiritimatiellia bacterium]